MQLADWDIGAIAMHLADQDYMFGTEPSCADASVAAVLIACGTEYFDTPLSGLVHKHANLVAYIDRMKTRYFADIDWPVSYMMDAEPA